MTILVKESDVLRRMLINTHDPFFPQGERNVAHRFYDDEAKQLLMMKRSNFSQNDDIPKLMRRISKTSSVNNLFTFHISWCLRKNK